MSGPDVTPKTESGRALPSLDEAVNDLMLLIPAKWYDREIEAAVGIIIAAAGREAASKAVAEVRGPFNALTADWPPIQRSKALAAFDAAAALIASGRGKETT